MKIILLNDVKKKGKKGEVLTVKDGYGNFLISSGQALIASESNLKDLDRNNEKKKKEEETDIKECEKVKERLEKEKIEFKVKTGASDKVFGSVSAKQIEKELKSKGYNIDKKNIIISNPLSSLGVFEVKIELHKKVVATIKVNLVK